MAGATPNEDPWLLACSCYIKDLDKGEQKIFETASLENLFSSAITAQKDYEEQSKAQAISKKLGPFVDAISQYSEALDVYSNTYSIAMAPLWGSIRVLLHVKSNPGPTSNLIALLFKQRHSHTYVHRIAKAFEKYFKNLVDMFARIGDNLPRCQIYRALFPSYGRLLQAISVVYLDVIHFCVNAKKTFRKLKKSSTVPLMLKMLWKDFNAEFEDKTLVEFRDNLRNMEKEVMVSYMIEGSNDRALMQAKREERERERKIEKRNFLLSTLSSRTYVSKHMKERKRRHSGTGTWLAKTSEFKNWLGENCSTCLWCYGIPGSGKTILASSLIIHSPEKLVGRTSLSRNLPVRK